MTTRVQPLRNVVVMLAAFTFASGAGGMAMSFTYLASLHHLDVVAGAAGFIAGSILVAGGLLALVFSERAPARPRATLAETPAGVAMGDCPVDVPRWIAHFARNQRNRPEPAWDAPTTLAADVVPPLLRSLEQFQLGDGGGPAYLIARDRETFLGGSAGTRALVDQWFAEEREHSRLLGAAVARFGGCPIQGHWSFTAFCLTRRWFGVRFELTVLLLTEIASTVYYLLLWRHADDPALRAMCRLILGDERGHIAFHRDRLARAARAGGHGYGWCWECGFHALGLAAATMLWVNHAPGLRAVGATGGEFYRQVGRELARFVRRLRSEARAHAERASRGAPGNVVPVG